MMQKIFGVLILALIIAGTWGSWQMYVRAQEIQKSNSEGADSKEQVVATPSPQPELKQSIMPTSYSAELEDRSSTSIAILNGSGVPGDADRAQSYLEDLDYTVEEIGNADNFNYTQSSILYHPGVSNDLIEKLREELAKNYVVEEPKNDSSLDHNEVVIVIGSEKVPD